MGFVHLHLHTEFSLLDGACRIGDMMEHVKAIGQDTVAITDHGVMYGAVDFIKPQKSRRQTHHRLRGLCRAPDAPRPGLRRGQRGVAFGTAMSKRDRLPQPQLHGLHGLFGGLLRQAQSGPRAVGAAPRGPYLPVCLPGRRYHKSLWQAI